MAEFRKKRGMQGQKVNFVKHNGREGVITQPGLRNPTSRVRIKVSINPTKNKIRNEKKGKCKKIKPNPKIPNLGFD